MTDPTGDALKASAAQVPALTKTQIETLSNNIHNVNDYAYTIECLTYHLGAAALSPVEQAPQPARLDLAKLIKARLIGVDPDDQDLQLEDEDWSLICAALEAPTEAPPVESQGAGWQSMETAPKDGTKFVALERWPSGNIYARVYEWTGRPNYWSSKRDGVCIRPDYQDRYMWVPLPPALAAEGSAE